MNPSWIELKNQVLGDLEFSAHFLTLLSFVYIFVILVNIHNKEYSRCSYFNDYWLKSLTDKFEKKTNMVSF